MDLQTFQQRRSAQLEAAPKYRELCGQCRQPGWSCYCSHVLKFNPQIKFVILTHPMEMRRRIATGLMSHLCLENSEWLIGQDYSASERIEELLNNPELQPMVLYPGRLSVNLSEMSAGQRSEIFLIEKTPLVFVIDGTWATARKTMRLSKNLIMLPRVCFTPAKASRFRVRKQPRANCLSTIEAIHHFIELMGTRPRFDLSARTHDGLMRVFDAMVERQIEFIRRAHATAGGVHYRRPRPQVFLDQA
jgi:DTW domain-containing protein YfiP